MRGTASGWRITFSRIALLLFCLAAPATAGAFSPIERPQSPTQTILVADVLVDVSLTNTTQQPVAVFAVDVDGVQRPRGELTPGQHTDLKAKVGVTLRFMQNGQQVGDGYAVTAQDHEQVSVPYHAGAAAAKGANPAPSSEKAAAAAVAPGGIADVILTNTTKEPIAVIAVDASGAQHPREQLAPGQRAQLQAKVEVTLGFSQNGQWLGDGYVVGDEANQQLTLPYNAAAAAGPAAPAQTHSLSVTSTTGAPVAVVVLNGTGGAHLLQRVPPGKTESLPASAGMELGFEQGKKWLGDGYKVEGVAGEAVSIPHTAVVAGKAPQGAGAKPATGKQLEVVNGTGAPIVVVEIGANGQQTPLGQLKAGQSGPAPVGPGVTLAFAQNGGWVGQSYTVTGAAGETVKVPYAGGPSAVTTPSPAGGSPVAFTNTTKTAVTVATLDTAGDASALYEIEPGQTVTQAAPVKSQLYFYPSGAQKPIGDDYVVTGANDQVSIPYDAAAALKASQSGPGSVTLNIHNETGAAIDVAMADAGGIRRNLYQIARNNAAANGVGENIQIRPGTQIYFVKAGSGPAVAFGSLTVVANGPKTIYVPYDATAQTQKQPNPRGGVSVMFTNSSTAQIDCGSQGQFMFRLGAGAVSWRPTPFSRSRAPRPAAEAKSSLAPRSPSAISRDKSMSSR